MCSFAVNILLSPGVEPGVLHWEVTGMVFAEGLWRRSHFGGFGTFVPTNF